MPRAQPVARLLRLAQQRSPTAFRRCCSSSSTPASKTAVEKAATKAVPESATKKASDFPIGAVPGGISRGSAEKAAGIGYGSALLLSLVGFGGGAAYVWYEQEEKHAEKLKSLPHMAPYAGLSLRQLCGAQWFEIGGIKPAPQSQFVGTSFSLRPQEEHGSKVASVSLSAKSHLVSLWAPAMEATLGTVRPNSKHTATATTLSREVLPEYFTLQGDLWVLDAGMANGDPLKSHDSPDWLLVVNGADRRAAWLLSRQPLVTSQLQFRAMQQLQRLGFDISKWSNTPQSLSLYGSPEAAAAAHAPLPPPEDPLDAEDQQSRAEATARAAHSPPAVSDLAKRALHSSRAAAAAAKEEVQAAVAGGAGPADTRTATGAKSPHDLAMQLLHEVRALRASATLEDIQQERQLRK